jgi:hypothetical protein
MCRFNHLTGSQRAKSVVPARRRNQRSFQCLRPMGVGDSEKSLVKKRMQSDIPGAYQYQTDGGIFFSLLIEGDLP